VLVINDAMMLYEYSEYSVGRWQQMA